MKPGRKPHSSKSFLKEANKGASLMSLSMRIVAGVAALAALVLSVTAASACCGGCGCGCRHGYGSSFGYGYGYGYGGVFLFTAVPGTPTRRRGPRLYLPAPRLP